MEAVWSNRVEEDVNPHRTQSKLLISCEGPACWSSTRKLAASKEKQRSVTEDCILHVILVIGDDKDRCGVYTSNRHSGSSFQQKDR